MEIGHSVSKVGQKKKNETFGRRRDIPSGQLLLNRGSKSLFPSVFRKESPQNVSCLHDEIASALRIFKLV